MSIASLSFRGMTLAGTTRSVFGCVVSHRENQNPNQPTEAQRTQRISQRARWSSLCPLCLRGSIVFPSPLDPDDPQRVAFEFGGEVEAVDLRGRADVRLQ